MALKTPDSSIQKVKKISDTQILNYFLPSTDLERICYICTLRIDYFLQEIKF